MNRARVVAICLLAMPASRAEAWNPLKAVGNALASAGRAIGGVLGAPAGGFIESATSDLSNVRAEPFDILVVEFARKVGAKTIVKGLRAISDFEYEFEMHQLNRMQAPDVDTLYLMASPQYSFLSSSGVKEIATFGGNIGDLVPEGVAERLQEELSRHRTV